MFGLVIFVHELGHFLAAKAVGVYAPRFSIGFGPALFRFRRGETEYVLAALPLGGYVRMASRHDAETAFIEGGAEEATAQDRDRSGLRSGRDDSVRAQAGAGESLVREQAACGAHLHHDRRRRHERRARHRRRDGARRSTTAQVVYPTTVVGAVHAAGGRARARAAPRRATRSAR